MSSNVAPLHSPKVSDEEWQVRVDLAALHRLYVKFGWTDLIYTHLTARCPDNPEHYLIKPDPFLMEEVTASSLNVRTGPSSRNTAMGAIPRGSRYVKVGRSGSWVLIQYDSRRYYVHGNYVRELSLR